MAGIIDPPNSAVLYLNHWSSTFKTHYVDKVADLTRRFGKTTRLIPKSKRTLDGKTMEFEFLARPNNGAQVTFDMLAPNTDPAPGQYGRFSLSFDAENPSSNDFMKINIGWKLTWYDLQKRGDSNWKDQTDFIERDVRQGIEGVAETFARSIHLPSDGALGTMAGSGATGMANADSDLFASATTYTAGSAIAMLKLSATAMQRIGDGQRVELRTSGGVLLANNLIVEYVNWADYSIVVRVATSSHTPGPSVDSGGNTVTNCNTFDDAAGNKLYLNGCYNVVPKLSLSTYFTPSSLFFGRNRLTEENYRMLLPNRVDAAAGGASVALTADQIHRMGRQLAWTNGDGNSSAPRTMVMNIDQYRSISRFAEDEGITLTPALQAQAAGEWVRKYGFDGVVFHDPNLGSVMIDVDDFAQYGVVDFLDMNNWEYVSPFGDGGFSIMPGTIGYWTQNTENDGSGRPSLFYSARGMQHFAFVPTHPKKDGRIFGLTSPTL